MKKILFSSILFFSSSAYAQIDSTNALIDTSQMKFIEPPDSTGFGTPDGQLISKEIGPAGGTIISDDGRVELIFPADALTINTKISIQPITNMAPNGAGKAYKCEPSGIQFKKPVQIIFHYTDKEAKTCPPELMGLVIQDDTGKWNFFDYDEWDSTNKILKGTIEHFSTPANSYKFKVVPDKRTVMVNEEIRISISGTYKKFKRKQRALSDKELSDLFYKWFVNNEDGETASAGTIRDKKSNSCTYKAPPIVPTVNPVTISVYISANGDVVDCEVEIYDGYQITVIATWKNFTAGNDITADFREYSSFIIKFLSDTRWKVDPGDIKNSLLLLERLSCPAKCEKKCRYINKADCTGIINIDGVQDVQISGDAAGSKKILISLEKSHGILPLVDGGGGECGQFLLSKGIPIPRLPAVPEKIQFPLDGANHHEYDFDLSQMAIAVHVYVSIIQLSPDGK